MILIPRTSLFLALAILSPLLVHAGLEPGNQIQITIRGVEPSEQQKVNGNYRVGETGAVRLPFLESPLNARGLNAEQFARSIEAAYRNAGIYSQPAIEVEPLQGRERQGEAIVSVGGNVRRAGETPFRKGMTVLQAIDASGGRNDFGSRNLLLFREGKQYILDFNSLEHKNIKLRPGDSLQVEQKGVVDRWKGNQESVKPLLERRQG